MGFKFMNIFRRPSRDKEADEGLDIYNDLDHYNRLDEEDDKSFQEAQGNGDAEPSPSAQPEAIGMDSEAGIAQAGPAEQVSVPAPRTAPPRIFNAQDWIEVPAKDDMHEEDVKLGNAQESSPSPPSMEDNEGILDVYEAEEPLEEKEPTVASPGVLGKFLGRFRKRGRAKGRGDASPKKERKTKPKSKQNESSTDPKKVAVLGLLLLVLCGLGYWLFSMMGPGLLAGIPGQSSQAPAKSKVNQTAGTVVQEASNASIPPNPFVPKSAVPMLAMVEGVHPKKAEGLPAASKTEQGGAQSTASFMQAPPVPSFSPPAIPKASTPFSSLSRSVAPSPGPSGSMSQGRGSSASGSSASGLPKVTGIIEGEGGNNVAIMSDGTIVSSGDTYQDGRIAWIGGDGIHFDNGNTMSFDE